MADFWSNMLTLGILAALALIFYLRFVNKTLGEMIKDLREGFKEEE